MAYAHNFVSLLLPPIIQSYALEFNPFSPTTEQRHEGQSHELIENIKEPSIGIS